MMHDANTNMCSLPTVTLKVTDSGGGDAPADGETAKTVLENASALRPDEHGANART